jgi:Uri superfamily endonuclease
MKNRGTYALVIALGVGLRVRVGRLGIHSLIPGYYVYTGSALGGLSGRLRYHLKFKKSLHWHIDYLLREAKIAQIWYALGQTRLECIWNAIIKDLPGSISSISGFGASDCQCSSHLTYFPTIPSFNLFEQTLRQSKLPEVYVLDLGNELMCNETSKRHSIAKS